MKYLTFKDKRILINNLCLSLKSNDDKQIETISQILNTDDVYYDMFHFIGDVGWICSQNEKFIGKTIDGGQTWTTYSGGLDITMGINYIYFIDLNTGFCVGSDTNGNYSIILKSIDGGENWTEVYSAYDTFIDKLKVIDIDNIWFIAQYYDNGNYPIISKTSNGGITWDLKYEDQDNGGAIPMDIFVNGNTILSFITNYSNNYHIIIKSTDNGENWNIVYDDLYGHISDVYFYNENIMYIASTYDYNDIKIYKTTNGSITWSVVYETTNYAYYNPYIFGYDENNLFLVPSSFNNDYQSIILTNNSFNTIKELPIDFDYDFQNYQYFINDIKYINNNSAYLLFGEADWSNNILKIYLLKY